ncbi:AH receptor-interacting protein-like [Clavelina lepadiformis]|uniref:AH receptor-interacting protein-like n=1 Tax=Clavelina lepadiformis TaxID=159417 RepID=UPI0040427B9E
MVIMTEKVGKFKVQKNILKHGNGKKPSFETGSKATFHFRTIKENNKEQVVIDDSRKWGKPFELLIGRSFKLECWEECVATMMHGEIAQFVCPLQCVMDYPTISKSLRDLHFGKKQSGHSCGLHAAHDGLGYDDLNQLQQNMVPLVFEFELLKVEGINTYEKELWQMDANEMLASIPKYHEDGNRLFRNGKIDEAEKKYANAIGCLKHLQIKERPGTDSWIDLDKQQIPLLLNYAQCKLNQGEYTVCITNCSEVLEKIDGNNNVKALFKRGKAHSHILDETECRADFDLALKLDPSIRGQVNRELKALSVRQKQRDCQLSKHLKGMFETD